MVWRGHLVVREGFPPVDELLGVVEVALDFVQGGAYIWVVGWELVDGVLVRWLFVVFLALVGVVLWVWGVLCCTAAGVLVGLGGVLFGPNWWWE